MRKSKLLTVLVAAAIGVSMVGCGSSGGSSSSGSSGSSSGGDVANKDKPLCWYNRQPSNSSTGELDKTALTFNDKTYYVGFDANQGAELQGQMVLEYIDRKSTRLNSSHGDESTLPSFFTAVPRAVRTPHVRAIESLCPISPIART